jgi:hypothetical protein
LDKATFIDDLTVFAFWRADLQLQIGAARQFAIPRRAKMQFLCHTKRAAAIVNCNIAGRTGRLTAD